MQWRLPAPVGGGAGCSPGHTVTTREHSVPGLAGGSLTGCRPAGHPRTAPQKGQRVPRAGGQVGGEQNPGRPVSQAWQAGSTQGPQGGCEDSPPGRRTAAEAQGSCRPAAHHGLGTSAVGAFGALLTTAPCPTEVTTTPKNGWGLSTPGQVCSQAQPTALSQAPAVGDKASLCPQSKPHCTATEGPTWRWESRTGDLISHSRVDTVTTDHLSPRAEALDTQTRL